MSKRAKSLCDPNMLAHNPFRAQSTRTHTARPTRLQPPPCRRFWQKYTQVLQGGIYR